MLHSGEGKEREGMEEGGCKVCEGEGRGAEVCEGDGGEGREGRMWGGG